MKTPQQKPFKPLQKTNDRWKWMVGATAVSAAASTVVQAQTAQISLINNQNDSVSGNSLSLSVSTGHPFGSVSHAFNANGIINYYGYVSFDANANLKLNGAANKIWGTAWHYASNNKFVAELGSIAGTKWNKLAGAENSSGSMNHAFILTPFTLTDPNVNGGADTNALLEIEAFNQSSTDDTIALLSIFYDMNDNNTPSLSIDPTLGTITGDTIQVVGTSDAATGTYTPVAVPEPSGLALLALGAAGILARRKLKKAA